MAVNPNAPTTPAADAAGDQGTGPGDGLDTTTGATPETPDADTATDPAGTSEPPPFTEEEIASAPPGDQERMRGMLKTFTQTQQRLKAKERELSSMIDRVSERLARPEEPAALADASEPAQPSPDQDLEELYSTVDPAVRGLLSKFEKAITRKVEQKFAPVASGAAVARSTAEIVAAKARHADFEQVVNVAKLQQAMAANPNLNVEQVYRLLKYDQQAAENARLKAELTQHQLRQKRAAVTERPSGPAAADLDFTWWDKMKPEDRANLDSLQIWELQQKHARV